MTFNIINILPLLVLLILKLCELSLQSLSSGDSSHKIETSHSNTIPSFDDSIYYTINWLPNNHLSSDDNEEVDKQTQAKDIVMDSNTLWVSTTTRERYRCDLPLIDTQSLSASSPESIESELSAYQLLKPLFVREPCSYRLDQYWTYEICHGRYIRQFHEDSTAQKARVGASQEYYLGKYDISRLSSSESNFNEYLATLAKDGKKRPTVTVDDTQLPYIEINMTDGTLCDLSNTKRFTRVLYVCNEHAKHELYSIKETSTCEYEAIVLSPLICLNSDFKVTSAPENLINCYALGKSPLKPRGLKAIENEAKKQQLESQKSKKDYPPFPGGIFDGKTIIIGASEFGKELRISIVSEDNAEDNPKEDLSPKFDSKILTSFLSGELCLHGGTGWWKYEYCYGDKVLQYHEEKGNKVSTITLGKWDKSEHIKWIDKNQNRKPEKDKTPKQVSHFYSNGDLCDVTDKPRQVEVKLKCRNIVGHPDSVALYLVEPKTCEYILIIESPIVCHLLSTVDEYGLMHNPNDNVIEHTITIDEIN